MKKLRPDIPAALWEYLQQEGRTEVQRSLGEVEEPMIALYDRRFSDEDIRQLLAFYDSPIGRKLLAAMPQVQLQSAALGNAWARRWGSGSRRGCARRPRRRGTISGRSRCRRRGTPFGRRGRRHPVAKAPADRPRCADLFRPPTSLQPPSRRGGRRPALRGAQ
jgi:hypothetical protein